jgi:hypothetical protein
MTEVEKPIDPELTTGQVALKALTDEVLALKPKNPLTFWDVGTSLTPQEVERLLAESPMQELMLEDGKTLSDPHGGPYHNNLDLYIGRAELGAVTLRAWGWEYDKYRVNPATPEPPYDIIGYPEEKDWSRQLDINLHYSNRLQTATQTFTASTSSDRAGSPPWLSRDVTAQAYAEMGYEGHNQKFNYDAVDEEVLAFLGICRQIFDNRVERPKRPTN